MSLQPTSLHLLFHQLAIARNQRELRLRFMDLAGELFGAQHWGIHLLDAQHRPSEADVRGLPDAFVELYEKIGRAIDPVMRYVVEQHAPAHEQLVLMAEDWKQSLLYQNVCSGYDHEHIMTGPLLGGGHLIGTVHFSRGSHAPAFNAEDIAKLSALCNHLSVGFATLRTQPNELNLPLANRLTQRELQIAELVAQGLSNAEIGVALWISQNSVKQALKRMFRKLKVSSRAEMVAKLLGLLGNSYQK